MAKEANKTTQEVVETKESEETQEVTETPENKVTETESVESTEETKEEDSKEESKTEETKEEDSQEESKTTEESEEESEDEDSDEEDLDAPLLRKDARKLRREIRNMRARLAEAQGSETRFNSLIELATELNISGDKLSALSKLSGNTKDELKASYESWREVATALFATNSATVVPSRNKSTAVKDVTKPGEGEVTYASLMAKRGVKVRR